MRLEITDEEGNKFTAELKEPSFDEAAAAIKQQSQQGTMYAGEYLLNTLWKSGDEEIKERVDLKLSACSHVWDIVKIAKGELKKK